MPTINDVKQLAEAQTPVLLFQCVLPTGAIQYWSTHPVSFNSQPYAARVLKHNVFELQASVDDAMDSTSQLSITLANADSYMSQVNQEAGFKGARVTVSLIFADLVAGTTTSDSLVLFHGIGGDPDELTESTARVTFTNRLSLQRIPVPDVRIQSTCPWTFPSTTAQRIEAMDGGPNGSYSRFYRCGYSADITGGAGNLNNGVAFTTCDKSRASCQARGMFSSDSSGRTTSRFGGFEFIPSAIQVRTAGDKTSHISPLVENVAKYNNPVPLVYGTGWLKAPVDFCRNDGNYTHLEVILSLGPITQVMKVIVEGVEIPLSVQGTDLSATGWYSVVTTGARNGNFNLDFRDSAGNAVGDPFGSIAVLSVVVPNRIASGTSLPAVTVLMQGQAVPQYDATGTYTATSFSASPAWIILDLLRRGGWQLSELNLASFAASDGFCSALITGTDANGNAIQTPRYQCNLILATRQSAASVIRGVRVAAGLMLRYDAAGLLELVPEAALSIQHPTLPDGSNAVQPLNGGWPAYEFCDGSAGFSGIARLQDGSSSVRISARSVAETCNRLSVEFQDSLNEYQQDSLSVNNADDSALIGYEVVSQSTAMGIANMNQAARVLLRQLDKSINGNYYAQWQTSFRAAKVRPGDIVTLTYLKEGLQRVPFRVLKIVPSLNYEALNILAQIHNDDWYSDSVSVLAGSGRQPNTGSGAPRPLIGLAPHNDANGNLEFYDFATSEAMIDGTDGSATDTITIGFSQPSAPAVGAMALPIIGMSPTVSMGGGTLVDGQTLYYAVTAVGAAGDESQLSFTVAATISTGPSGNAVTLTNLSFPASAATMNVYRGSSPQLMYRIATAAPVAANFTDTGLSTQPIGPPDPNFARAMFYYRDELAGPFTTFAASSTTIACADMGAVPSAYTGATVRIIEGTGRGQERLISGNTATTLTLVSPWTVIPDNSSQFVIVESAWNFGAVTATSPVQISVAYRQGRVIEITGRAVNAENVESAPELCPVTRLALGAGSAGNGTTVPPSFSLSVPGAGILTLSGIGFSSLQNISSISSGTLATYTWNELNSGSNYTLAGPMDSATATLYLVQPAPGFPGQIIQLGTELMEIVSIDYTGNSYQVLRAVMGSVAAPHAVRDAVMHLQKIVSVVPFALGFFLNKASLNFIHNITQPDVRIAAAELFATNGFGDSQSAPLCFTTSTDGGLRTLSGGQFALQVAGTLATEQAAAPPVTVEASHAVRDVRAVVGQAPQGYDVVITVMQDTSPYCTLTIPSGATVSNVIDGATLGPLQENRALTVNVVLNVDPTVTSSTTPGRDLTVTIRL